MNQAVLNMLTDGISLPFRSDLVQHLFKSGETDVITPDGLYAKDFSGNNNHALLKSSFMCTTAAGGNAVHTLSSPIVLLSSDTWELELYFYFDATVAALDNFYFFGNSTGAPDSAHIRFRHNSLVRIQDNAGLGTSFNNAAYIDFSILRKYRFSYAGGNISLYVNDNLQQTVAFSGNYTIRNFIGSGGGSSIKGQYFGLKITKNSSIIHYWPCQSGAREIHDVVGDMHLNPITLYNDTPGLQNLLHYHLKYGCDLWSNHADKKLLVPKKMNGTSILLDNSPTGAHRYWNRIISNVSPFNFCDTTIQTLKGDIKFSTLKAVESTTIFSNITSDQTFRDILVYNTSKSAEEITKINRYTRYNIWSQYKYNESVIATIRDIIKTGTARYLTIGDSLSPFTHRFQSQLQLLCGTKGIGFGVATTGNYQQNILDDILVSPGGTDYEYINNPSNLDQFGLNGITTWFKTGNTLIIDPRNHYYTNVRILYSKNTDKGSFDVVLADGTHSVNCNAAQGLGIASFTLAESTADVVLNNFSGNVYIYGFELNNTGAVNHIFSHGGYSTANFLPAFGSHIAEYCAATTLDFAFIMIGANDAMTPRSKADFKVNLSTLIGYLKSGNANLPIILLTPTTRGLVADTPGEDLTYWGYVRQYTDAMKELSDELVNVCVIDLGLLFPRWNQAIQLGWMDGVIHHTPIAQEWEARQLYKLIINT